MSAVDQKKALQFTPERAKRSLKRTLLALLVLIVIWPALRYAYRPTYAWLGAAAVNLVGSNIIVVPEAESGGAIAHDTPLMDTVFHFDHKVYGRGGGAIPASSFYHAYFPTAILLALIWGARDGDLRSKKKVLIATLLALHIFLVLRLSTAVAMQLNASVVDDEAVLELSAWSAKALRYTKDLFWDNAISTILFPIAIWAFFAFNEAKDNQPASR